MADYQSDPICVVGMPRSGTTWMQFALSEHPRIHIAGQYPNIAWETMWSWRQQLVAAGRYAVDNMVYRVPHYAGSSIGRCDDIFRRMFCDFITGLNPDMPRWGGKFITMCANPDEVRQFEQLWPAARWIVCVRDPFRSYNSAMNTFGARMSLAEWCQTWIKVVRFAMSHDPARTILFQIDQLEDVSPDERIKRMADVLSITGENEAPQLTEFVQSWAKVHWVKPEAERVNHVSETDKSEIISQCNELRSLLADLNYQT